MTRLRVLVAVARHGSVTAAARSLNYAQPSVSHHLARLEAETGARLTQRSGRGIRLTDAGRLLAGRAEEILGRLDAAERELAAHVEQRQERIRLAVFASALATIVPAALSRLAAGHPGIDLLLAEAEPPEAMRMLRAGQVDVALVSRHTQNGTPVGPPAAAEGARTRLILDEQVHLVTRPRHRGTAGQPGAGQPHVGQPSAVQPGAGQPHAAQPSAVPPSAVPPSAVPPGAAQPHAGQPSAAQPGAGQPHAGQPGAAQPSAAQPGAAQPHAGQPGAAQPSAAQPGGGQPTGEAGVPDLAAHAHSPWIAGCEHCRGHLIWLCQHAGFSPKIAFTTDDHVAAQALVAAGLGVTIMPGLAINAARHPGIHSQPLPGAWRQVLAVTYGQPPDPRAVDHLLDILTLAAAATATASGSRSPGSGSGAGAGVA